jgi:hypothetical protein
MFEAKPTRSADTKVDYWMIGGSIILVNVSVPNETIRIRAQVEQYMRASHLRHGGVDYPGHFHGLRAEIRDIGVESNGGYYRVHEFSSRKYIDEY